MSDRSDMLLDETKIERALTRIAHEILEHNCGSRIARDHRHPDPRRVSRQTDRRHHRKTRVVKVPVGLMDISLYRDDVHSKLDQPIVQRTDILFDVAGRNIILVDDVLFTGRTIRAALDQIIDFGRPKTIQLAVLVDRGHRELPIKADYVGVNIPTAKTDQVVLEVKEKEGADRVLCDQRRRSGKAGQTGKKPPETAKKKGKSR